MEGRGKEEDGRRWKEGRKEEAERTEGGRSMG